MTWRYLAQRLAGPSRGEFIDLDLPLSGVTLTERLSGPWELSGNIPVEVGRLRDTDGSPLLKEWGTAIYAEEGGVIRGAGILAHSTFAGPSWSLDCVGFSGYAQGLPYTDSKFFVEADPLDIARHIWAHIQTKHSNIGLVLDNTKSPVRIGTKLEQVEFDPQGPGAGQGPVSFEAGPYKLAWYQTDNLGDNFDKLAEDTPFEYVEEHAWNAARTDVTHRLRLVYPRMGSRRRDLRFVLNENIFVPPAVEYDGDEYANRVLALGAGEGRNMLRSPIVATPVDRLARTAVVSDKSLRSVTALTKLANRELALRSKIGDVTSVTVLNHPHARLGSYRVGDEILLQGSTGWVDLNQWCRIISMSITPDGGDATSVSVLRSDRAASQ